MDTDDEILVRTKLQDEKVMMKRKKSEDAEKVCEEIRKKLEKEKTEEERKSKILRS